MHTFLMQRTCASHTSPVTAERVDSTPSLSEIDSQDPCFKFSWEALQRLAGSDAGVLTYDIPSGVSHRGIIHTKFTPV
jgi:hypothetical protein